MDFALFEWGQFATLLLVAFALGMDAFSLGIGVGMVGIRLREIVKVSGTIGLFHVGMPMLGILLGMYMSELVGDIATLIGGIILAMIGLHMLWNGFHSNEQMTLHTNSLGLLLLSFSVSLDALTVGFSFGLLEVNKWIAVCLIGIMGGLLAGFGLLLGRSIGSWLGQYSEVLGGLILFAFGLKFML